MGYFTWTLANRKPKLLGYEYSESCKLQYGGVGYIALPIEFKEMYDDISLNEKGHPFLTETFYDGYGMFGKHDAYDVVVDLNKGHLVEFLSQPTSTDWFRKEMLEVAKAYEGGKSEEEIKEVFAKVTGWTSETMKSDWKRNIGIAISCSVKDNSRLPYPLKIVSTMRCKKYEELKPSDSTQ